MWNVKPEHADTMIFFLLLLSLLTLQVDSKSFQADYKSLQADSKSLQADSKSLQADYKSLQADSKSVQTTNHEQTKGDRKKMPAVKYIIYWLEKWDPLQL